MDWLKNAIGEENYNSLDKDFIGKLTNFLGSKKFIEDDKSKFIEKHVFNQQREELKEAKTKINEFEKELENRKDLITSDEHKFKLVETEKIFNQKLTEIEENYKKENEMKDKQNSLMNLFVTNGSLNPEFMLKNVNLDDVIIKDGKIQNGPVVLENMRKNVPQLFNTMNPNIPPSGQHSEVTKESLKKDFDKMMSSGNIAGALGVQRRIKELDDTK